MARTSRRRGQEVELSVAANPKEPGAAEEAWLRQKRAQGVARARRRGGRGVYRRGSGQTEDARLKDGAPGEGEEEGRQRGRRDRETGEMCLGRGILKKRA